MIYTKIKIFIFLLKLDLLEIIVLKIIIVNII